MTADILAALQQEGGGSIPFDRFMGAALYDPQVGYYTRHIRSVGGARGDFSTWPGRDRSLAHAVAAWLREEGARDIVEVGAGTGRLAADVLSALGWFRRWRTTLHIVEISPVLRARQQEVLRGRNVAWHSSLSEALRSCGGRADIYSNELPDAFPCRAFLRTDSGWSEIGVQIEGGTAREVLRPGVLPPSSALCASLPPGSRVEVHESYQRWLASWSPDWREGRMLTVDYGDEMPGLYHRRPGGSLRAYAHQQRFTGAGIYTSFGHRDITADVNFTDLRAWGEELGWETCVNSTLKTWLEGHANLAPNLQEAAEAFRVLVQRRAIEASCQAPSKAA